MLALGLADPSTKETNQIESKTFKKTSLYATRRLQRQMFCGTRAYSTVVQGFQIPGSQPFSSGIPVLV
jgi:hypothetical protein